MSWLVLVRWFLCVFYCCIPKLRCQLRHSETFWTLSLSLFMYLELCEWFALFFTPASWTVFNKDIIITHVKLVSQVGYGTVRCTPSRNHPPRVHSSMDFIQAGCCCKGMDYRRAGCYPSNTPWRQASGKLCPSWRDHQGWPQALEDSLHDKSRT